MANHKAIIAKIDEVIEIPGADKIHLAIVLGERVVVSKDWGVGFIGVLFPVELQLSEEFCHHNNLNRDSALNADKEKKGFFEKNRRVRAQPFLKVKSEGFFAGIDCLAYTGVFEEDPMLLLGSSFDEINGHKICQKYVNEKTRLAAGNKNTKAAKVNFAPDFAKHVDSEQFRHNVHKIQAGSLISFHSKKHGTSFRVGRVHTNIELPKWKQFINKVLPIFPTQKMDYVVGTRNVVLKNSEKEGFHGSEQFRFDVLEQLKPFLEDNMLIFGEIVGFVNGKPIMAPHSTSALKDKKALKQYGETMVYSYGCKEHEFKWFVYRIAYVVNGEIKDFTQKQLEAWCVARNIQHTYDLHPQIIFDGNHRDLSDLVEKLSEREEFGGSDPLDPTHLHEGTIVRVDNGKAVPDFYKFKTYRFRVCEGHCEAEDTEDAS